MTYEFEKLKDVERIFNDTADVALASTARPLRLMQVLESTKEELLNWNVVKCRNVGDCVVHGREERVVLDPQLTVPRERPRDTRLRSSIEGGGRRNARKRAATKNSNSQNQHKRKKKAGTLGAAEEMMNMCSSIDN